MTTTRTLTCYALRGDVEPYMGEPFELGGVIAVANELDIIGNSNRPLAVYDLRAQIADGDAFDTDEENEIVEVTITITVVDAG